jgi:rSAM/selenodomain-associated transferase 1
MPEEFKSNTNSLPLREMNERKPANNLIIIFTRNPELGKVKTRLAKTIGDQGALNVYRYLLEHTQKTIRDINADKAVYYSVKIRDNDIWDKTIYNKYQQEGEDLGQRMLHAFDNGFKNGYEKIVIVGSDLFHLEPKHLEEAIEKLEANDVVFGPAEDGGYYLLGMKQLHVNLFKNKAWGTSTVFRDSLNDLKNESVFLLEQLNDIDVFDDLKNIDVLKPLYQS